MIIYGVGAGIGTGTWGDVLAVHHINKPAEFVILRTIGIIAERNAEIERGQPVHGVDGLDGSVENLGGIEHHR